MSPAPKKAVPRKFQIGLSDTIFEIRKNYDVTQYGGNGSAANKRTWDRIEHSEWAPKVMMLYGKECGGATNYWETKPGQEPYATGSFRLLPIDQIYGDWQGVVYFPDLMPEAQVQQLRAFKIVDFFADEACVGLYHTEAKDPQLYYYSFEDMPEPLGLDLLGYIQLLPLTLGLRYWQVLLAELARDPARPYQPQTVNSQEIAAQLEAVVPGFSLPAFVQRYDELRLPR